MNISAEMIIRTGMITMMSLNKRGLSVVVSGILVVAPAMASYTCAQVLDGSLASVPSEASKAATESLSTFNALNAPPGAEAKFVAPGAAKGKEMLGAPLRDYIIGLNSLKAWDGKDPSRLLKPTNRFVYPIIMGGEVKSQVTLSERSGSWQPVEFSNSTLSQATSETREKIRNNAPGAAAVPSIQVRIPAMNATFLAQQENGDLTLTAVQSLPEYGIESGQSASARSVLLKLQPFAKEIDSSLPN